MLWTEDTSKGKSSLHSANVPLIFQSKDYGHINTHSLYLSYIYSLVEFDIPPYVWISLNVYVDENQFTKYCMQAQRNYC